MDGKELLLVEERMPPDTREDRHAHATARQAFYVLTGALAIEVDGVEHSVETGQVLEVPPGAAHQVINGSGDEVRFLAVATPTTKGDRAPRP